MPSLRAKAMNAWLRLTEKRHLARTSDVNKLRRSFELKAHLCFHAPRGTQFSETMIQKTPALHVAVTGVSTGPRLLYFHGGAYIMGSPRTHAAMLAHLCKFARCRAILPDYRKAPENRFPAAVEDALEAYQSLLISGENPSNIVLGGDSAGGGLALALLGEICRLGLPQPSGLFAFSPFTDMSFSGASYRDNARADAVLPVSRMDAQRREYLCEIAPTAPRASPIFANFEGACPVWIAVGSTEILRDDSVGIAARLKEASVDVTLVLEADLPHVWPLFHGYFPEAKHPLKQVARWINTLQHRSLES